MSRTCCNLKSISTPKFSYSIKDKNKVTDTDLNLESTGTGDILLRANPAAGTLGNIHLLRNDAARFNTIEYKNHPSSAYIIFLVNNGVTATGYGNLEIGGASGGFIDLKLFF